MQMSTNLQAQATGISQPSTNQLSEAEGIGSHLPRSDSSLADLGQQNANESNTSRGALRSLSAQDDSEAETEILGGSHTTTPVKAVKLRQKDKNQFLVSANMAGRERVASWEAEGAKELETSEPYSTTRMNGNVVSSERDGIDGLKSEPVFVSSSDSLHQAEACSTKEARLSPDTQTGFGDVPREHTTTTTTTAIPASTLQKQESELCDESEHQPQSHPIFPPDLSSPRSTVNEKLSGSRSPVYYFASKRSSFSHSNSLVTESKHQLRSSLPLTETVNVENSNPWSEEYPRKQNHIKKSNRKIPSAAMPARRDIDKNGRTPLARACADVDMDKVKIHLTQSSGDIDKPDHAGNTPLQIAALDGAADIVNLLLDFGCNIHCANDMGDTPLIDAIENGRSNVVKILLDAGVDPQRANNKGNYPKDLIPQSPRGGEIMSYLDHAIAVRATTNSQAGPSTYSHGVGFETPRRSQPRSDPFFYVSPSADKLLEFSKDGDVAGIDYMLQCGIKPTNACMVLASTGGHVHVMNVLLAEGVPPDPDPATVGENNTPMMAAIGRGHPAAVELLLQQSSFDPKRLVGRKKYHQIAAKRRGPLWEQEVALLKTAAQGKSRPASPAEAPATALPVSPEASTAASSPSPSPRPKRRRLVSGQVLAVQARQAYLESMPRAFRLALLQGPAQPQRLIPEMLWIKTVKMHGPLYVIHRVEIDPNCPPALALEHWMHNTDVALTLGHHRLDDAKSLGWETIPGTPVQREIMLQKWGLQNDIYRDMVFENAPPAELQRAGVPHTILDDGVNVYIYDLKMGDEAILQYKNLPDDQIFWVRKADFLAHATPEKSPHLKDITMELGGDMHLDWIIGANGRWNQAKRKVPRVPDVKLELYQNGIVTEGRSILDQRWGSWDM